MSSRLVSPTVIGRDRELAAVDAALVAVADGRPTHLLIAGEAGVGKSRLVGEIAARANAREMRTLIGGCANVGDGGLPYGPILDILRDLARDLGAEALAALAGSGRADLARLLPALETPLVAAHPTPDGADAGQTTIQAGARQARLFDAVLGMVRGLASEAPLVLAIEDLHWADPATRELAAFLVRQLRADPVLLVLTYRADELHRRHPLLPWLAELERTGRVERLELGRLDVGRTAELLTAILGTATDPAVVESIHRRSDGNPFFVEELVMAQQDTDTRGGARLPPTLRQVLLARIAALPDAAQTVVGVAAVAGRHVEHQLLARVAGMDDLALLDALRTAVERQVLVTASAERGAFDGYTFRHALLQEAAYEELLPGERQRLHRAFAEALAGEHPGSGAQEAGHWAELAHHWTAARDTRRAFEASIRAGTAAARAFAFADAHRHDEQALAVWELVDDAEAIAGFDRVALLDRAAAASWLSGDPHRAVVLRRETVAAVDAATDPVRAGVMLERLGRALWNNTESDAALVACEAAVATIPAEPPTAERARVLAGFGQLLMLLDRWQESIALCEEAIDIASRVGARQAEGHARNTLGLDYAAAGRCDEAIASLRAAIRIAEDVGDADDIGRGYVNLTEALRDCGDQRGAMAMVHEGVAVAATVGISRTYGSFIEQNGIMIAYDLGDWEEARRLAEASASVEHVGRQSARYMLAHWLPLLVATGDPRAEARMADLRSMLVGYPVETQFNAPSRLADAEAALWRDDPEAALRAARTGIDELEVTRFHRYHLRLFRVAMRALADLASRARARRDADAEREARAAGTGLAAEMAVVMGHWRARQQGQDREESETDAAVVAAEHARVDGRPAIEAWETVVARLRAFEQPYVLAYARWREGEARLEAGDRSGAGPAVVEAWQIANRLGARPLREAVEGLAARARIVLEPPADRAAVGPDGTTAAPDGATAAPDEPSGALVNAGATFGLTRRELEVIPLLVQGRTNRQIADALFISESTAGVHVSNVIGKLGASSRTEAATIAVRAGLDR